MDRQSKYRQVRLQVTVGKHGHPVAVFTRSVLHGRAVDRVVAQRYERDPVPVDSLWDLLDLLEQAVADLKQQHPRPPSP